MYLPQNVNLNLFFFFLLKILVARRGPGDEKRCFYLIRPQCFTCRTKKHFGVFACFQQLRIIWRCTLTDVHFKTSQFQQVSTFDTADASYEGRQHRLLNLKLLILMSHVVRIDLSIECVCLCLCVSEFLRAVVITVSRPVGVIHQFHHDYTD